MNKNIRARARIVVVGGPFHGCILLMDKGLKMACMRAAKAFERRVGDDLGQVLENAYGSHVIDIEAEREANV